MLKINLNGDRWVEGTYNSYYFQASFGEHLLIIKHRGKEYTFVSSEPYSKVAAVRHILLREFLESRQP